MTPVPIHIVRTDGQVERLGEWHHDAKVLRLDALGFPFLGVDVHRLESDLPWLFEEMCPSGFIGRVYARRHADLRLPHDSRDWSAEQKLRVLSDFGESLSGNLIVGEASLASFYKRRSDFLAEVDAQDLEYKAFEEQLVADQNDPSSLGGARPKWVTERFLSKHSPPANTPLGLRWCDLLRVESLCSSVIDHAGVASVELFADAMIRADGRFRLIVKRFDRTQAGPQGGRIGCASLYHLAAHRQELGLRAHVVLNNLASEGAVPTKDAESMALVDAFSDAIGNNDAHLGNCSLLFDEVGKARLAPIYDVLPMIFAPRNDELPDVTIKPRATPVDPRVESWVHDLVKRVETDPVISAPFKDLWRRYVGA